MCHEMSTELNPPALITEHIYCKAVVLDFFVILISGFLSCVRIT